MYMAMVHLASAGLPGTYALLIINDKHLGLVNLWPARSPVYMSGDLAMASIVNISPSDLMTNICNIPMIRICEMYIECS